MKEKEESHTCPDCKTRMDIILKPDEKGRCPYCFYINKRKMCGYA